MGGLKGSTQQEAFFVRCDLTTMTQNDVNNGSLIVVVGVAPLQPAEFIFLKILRPNDPARCRPVRQLRLHVKTSPLAWAALLALPML